MGELLPLFPLSTVLFPQMLLPLHIFEPRYRLLVRRSLDREQPFGIVLIRSGVEGSGAAEPHLVGTSARIVGHSPLPDGRSYIVIRGERRFAIESFISAHPERQAAPDAAQRSTEPYLVGRVRYLEDDGAADAADLAARAADAYTEYLMAIAAASGEPRSEVPRLEATGDSTPHDVAYRVAAGLAIAADERQRLLEAPSARERLRAELRLLERENSLLRELLLRLRVGGEAPRLN